MIQKPEQLFYEYLAQSKGYRRVAGCDECGMGCFAGPTVAAAVVLDLDLVQKVKVVYRGKPLYLTDSKKLSQGQREALYPYIFKAAKSIGIKFVFPTEINEVQDMTIIGDRTRCGAASKVNADYFLVDHYTLPYIQIPSIGITKGDSKSASISAASIVGKVLRDRYMVKLSLQFPQYGWAKNKGYGSSAHQEALEKYGVTGQHRLFYDPIRALLE